MRMGNRTFCTFKYYKLYKNKQIVVVEMYALHTEGDDSVDDPAHTHKHAKHEAEHHQETSLLGRPLATSDVTTCQGCPCL